MADNLKVNFSTEEVTRETKVFTAIPPGFYKCAIVKVEDATVNNNDKGNFGKPYWKIQLKVQDGVHVRRVLFSNVMLFDGSLTTAAQLLKAVGMGDLVKKGTIPPGETLVGKVVDANVTRGHDRNQEKELRSLGDNSSVFKNDVRGFRAPQEGNTGAKANGLP